MEQKQMNIFDRFNQWLKESVMVKLLSIGFLVLLLLIPVSWIMDLIDERQSRMESVENEVAEKWSLKQNVTGPVLTIPYKKYWKTEKEGKVEIAETLEKAYFLPHALDVSGTIDPEKLNRGIFDVVVYNSTLDIKGSFNTPDFKVLGIASENVIWDQAYLSLGLNDLRGIKENPLILFNGNEMVFEPGQDVSDVFNKSISVKLNLTEPLEGIKPFSMKLALKGSQSLSFTPTGKTTSVQLSGKWPDPSFGGDYLPENREVTESGFTARWNVLHYNRPFPQQWSGTVDLSNIYFGVDLLMPVDQYQKSIRTAKYGILIIILTFIALFLIEIICKIRIHPFQYILIGAALIIYYTLLLSISEHAGFNPAYLMSSLATVSLISTYSVTFLPSKKVVALLTFLLTLFYGFIFTINQMQDYALLLGSIGLFIIVGVLMYVSRKVNWYGIEVKQQIA